MHAIYSHTENTSNKEWQYFVSTDKCLWHGVITKLFQWTLRSVCWQYIYNSFVILVAVRLVQLFHLYQTLHNGFGKHTDDWRVSCVESSATESCTAVLNTVSCSFIIPAMPPGPGWVWRLGCAADDSSGRAASEVGWCGRALTTSAIIVIIIITDATISNIISALHVQSQHSHSSVKPWLHVQLLHAIILAPVDRRALK